MKKISIMLIIGLLLMNIGSISGSDLRSLKSNSLDVICFNQPIITTTDSNSHLEFSDCSSLNTQDNSYLVPIKNLQYTYPLGTQIEEIQINPQHVQTQILYLPLEKTPSAQLLLSQDFDSYQTEELGKSITGWYGIDVGQGMISYGQRGLIVNVQLYPALYDAESMELQYAEEFEIEITTTYQPFSQKNSEEQYELLILSANKYTDELDSLVEHKYEIDIPTKLVSITDIESSEYFQTQGRDRIERVKYFIKNAIEHWNVTNVLIVGGIDSFPARETHVKVSNSDQELFVSDLYYADIYDSSGQFCSWDSNNNGVFCEYDWGTTDDDIDFYPDVHIGRLPVVDEDELEDVIGKIISYELSNAYAQEWFKTILYAGGDTFPGDDNQIDEGEYTNQAIIEVMDGYSSDIYWATNGRLEGVAPSGIGKLKNGMNQGAGFIDLSGHGNTRSWATHPHENPNQWLPQPTMGFLVSHAKGLNNEQLSIVVTGACSVAKYNENPDNFCWAFVANPDGGGIASFGCSALGYGYMGSYVTEGLIGAVEVGLFEAYQDYAAYTIGELLTLTINNYIFSGMDGADVKMMTEYHLFGDPSIRISDETFAPNTPDSPQGPISGSVGISYDFSASTTDPEQNDISYQFDWGDGQISDWSDFVSESTMISESHYWDNEGTYNVCVRAKDTRGLISDWSQPSALLILPPEIEITTIMSTGKLAFSFSNQGDVEIAEISWSYEVSGGFFGKIDFFDSGLFETFASGETKEVSLDGFLFGFGDISIDVLCDETQLHEDVRLFGPFLRT